MNITFVISERATPSSFSIHHLFIVMPQRRKLQQSYNKSLLHLALLAVQRDEIESGRRATAVYNIP